MRYEFKYGDLVYLRGQLGVVDFVHSDGLISVQVGDEFELCVFDQLTRRSK